MLLVGHNKVKYLATGIEKKIICSSFPLNIQFAFPKISITLHLYLFGISDEIEESC